MTTSDRKEQIRVAHHRKGITRQHVVEDVGQEHQAIVARVAQMMWLALTALESLLGVRVLLKLAAADPSVPFARFIYGASAWFLGPFNGLTMTPQANGVVFEVSTIIAMCAYALAGWLLVRLVWLALKPSARRSVQTYEELDQ